MRSLKGQEGFTLPAVIAGMFIAGLLTIAAFNAALADTPTARKDQDRQRAAETARAGLAWFAVQLANDQERWAACADGASTANPMNQLGSTTNKTTFGTDGDQTYALQLVPAPGQTRCYSKAEVSATNDPGKSMLVDNELRILSVGTARGKTRKMLGTFKRKSFLDYIYYTSYETLDPGVYTPSLQAQAAKCESYWPTRKNLVVTGGSGNKCTEINFVTGDFIRGPFHSNDSVHISGSPVFGQSGDSVEISEVPQWVGSGSAVIGSGAKFVPKASRIDVPPDNRALSSRALPAWTFTGRTVIDLAARTVINKARFGDLTARSFATIDAAGYPANGVIYVKDGKAGVDAVGGCTKRYSKGLTYAATPEGCGNAWVKGTGFNVNTTIAAANDIIINGNITRSGDIMLGLVATQFIRVYHNTSGAPGTTGVVAGSASPNTIEAGILSVRHSFIVDDWDQGPSLGTLNVTGAIAQKFRGTVGTSGGTGYLKNYTYDPRFRYRQPPSFLAPVDAEWKLIRTTEVAG